MVCASISRLTFSGSPHVLPAAANRVRGCHVKMTGQQWRQKLAKAFRYKFSMNHVTETRRIELQIKYKMQ